MILVLDNYDSFVHNVARYLRLGGKTTRVVRSDEWTAEQCRQMAPEAIVISPGPHRPEQAGCSLDVVRQLAGTIPLLGICLGHQTIAAAYGGEVVVGEPRHGTSSQVAHDATGVFAGLPSNIRVGRYHSLQVRAAGLPPSLQINAWTLPVAAGQRQRDDTADVRSGSAASDFAAAPSSGDSSSAEEETSVVMGIADHARCVHGVQFHPESWLTDHGHALFGKFFQLVDQHHRRARRVSGWAPRRRPVAWPGSFAPIGAATWDAPALWPNPVSMMFYPHGVPTTIEPATVHQAAGGTTTESAEWCRSAG